MDVLILNELILLVLHDLPFLLPASVFYQSKNILAYSWIFINIKIFYYYHFNCNFCISFQTFCLIHRSKATFTKKVVYFIVLKNWWNKIRFETWISIWFLPLYFFQMKTFPNLWFYTRYKQRNIQFRYIRLEYYFNLKQYWQKFKIKVNNSIQPQT